MRRHGAVVLLGLVLVSVILATLPLPLAAQTGRIRGQVTDSAGQPLAGAVITLEGTPFRVLAGARGAYEVAGVPAGTHTVRARLIGYLPLTAAVTLAAGETAVHDFTLARSTVQLAPVDVVVGSRARHTAAEELAVPVDVFSAEQIAKVGTTETSAILSDLTPSVNFPRQSVADASDIVRPFTLRGLSPDHALVLVNGWRRHRTALVHNFAAGMGAGSSGVDMNAIPSTAIDRIEVLRDGAAAQYGSDAIAGVVNLVIKDGPFDPYLRSELGRYVTDDFPDDGTTTTTGGGWGLPLGRGSLSLFGEYRYRNRTNRAGADPEDQIVAGDADEVDDRGNVIRKNNPVPQPNHHWGDGLASDALGFANLRLPVNQAGTAELYAFGGYSHRVGTGNGFRRQGISDRNWPAIYPLGYLPEFHPTVIDWSGAAGVRGSAGRWAYDLGASLGHDSFEYDLRNTLNVSLGPCLDVPCAPGLDGVLGTADDPGIPNKKRIDAGHLQLNELVTGANFTRPWDIGLAQPVNVAFGAQFRYETYEITPGEKASFIQGGHLNRSGEPAPPGSQVFAGFQPSNAVDDDRTNAGFYLDLEGNLTERFLANLAGRLESYSDFGERLTGKLALRYQPSRQVTFRGAVSTGFRAPALSQSFYGSSVTNFVLDENTGRQRPVEVGIFPVSHPAARALGARDLKAETSVNLSGGLAVSPRENLTLTADYYYVRIDDRIILTSELAGPGVEQILKDAGLTVERAQYFTNALDTKTEGLDFTGTWRLRAGDVGRLDLSASVNWTRNRIRSIREPPELAGTGAQLFDPFLTGGRVSLERERPAWRGTLGANYFRGRFRGQLRNRIYGKHTTAQLGACQACVQEIGANALVDLEVGYLLPGNLSLAFGAKNLFDTYPERLIGDNSFGIFLFPMASPFGYNGRSLYARTEITFAR